MVQLFGLPGLIVEESWVNGKLCLLRVLWALEYLPGGDLLAAHVLAVLSHFERTIVLILFRLFRRENFKVILVALNHWRIIKF